MSSKVCYRSIVELEARIASGAPGGECIRGRVDVIRTWSGSSRRVTIALEGQGLPYTSYGADLTPLMGDWPGEPYAFLASLEAGTFNESLRVASARQVTEDCVEVELAWTHTGTGGLKKRGEVVISLASRASRA